MLMETLSRWIGGVNDVLWTYVLVAALLGCAVWFTLRTRGVQFRLLGEMMRVLGESAGSGPKGERHVSSFQAFAVSLASRVGTGNLAGVATAIVVGGPGAVFWMWVIALVGAASAFVESTLAQLYKRRGRDSFIGGPAYYMERGLGRRWMGVLFAVLISVTFGFAFNSVQSNTICAAWEGAFGADHVWVGVVLTALTLLIIFGGIRRIARVSGVIVPIMALGYIVLALGVVVINYRRFPAVLASIVGGAFDPQAFTGGAIGSIFLSMQKGVSRGIFSNEAGLGTGSIAHACADTRKPVKQGMFGIFEVFADTIVICTLTAMVILCSGVPVGYGSAAGAELTISGFTATYGGWSSIFTAVALCSFAFSTIIGWGLYGSRCIEFLFHTDKVVGPFLVVYSFVSILGATVDLGLLWSIADTFNGLMSIPNLMALLLLSSTVAKLTKEFFAGEGAGK